LVVKGFYSGGLLYPQSGLPIRAVRDPFLAVGYDGTTVYDLSTQIVQYTAGVDNYHCILAKYNPLGTPATPTI